ncbi:hypothetical protein GCM10027456_20880 [Kineosporia babensis]
MLDSARVRVGPGGQERIPVLVQNRGQRHETFRVEVIGLPEGWWQLQPSEIELSGGEEGTVLLVLHPPATTYVSDEALPFGVRVSATSVVNQRCSSVTEGDLEVLQVLGLQAVMKPVTSKGRWWARHRVVYTNWGDADVTVRISTHASDDSLRFRVSPDELVVPVGGKASAQVRIGLRRFSFRGMEAWHPFRLTHRLKGPAPSPGTPVIHGAFDQVPVTFRGFKIFTAAVLVLMMLGLGFSALSATVEGTTKETETLSDGMGIEAEEVDQGMKITWDQPAEVEDFELWRIAPDLKPLKLPKKGVEELIDRGGRPQNCYLIKAYDHHRGLVSTDRSGC